MLRPRAKYKVQAALAWMLGKYYFGSYDALIREAGCVPRGPGRRLVA